MSPYKRLLVRGIPGFLNCNDFVRHRIPFKAGDALCSLLRSLTTREAQVLRLRHGIDCEQAHTLVEAATYFDVTSERIRQTEASAWRKLRLAHWARLREQAQLDYERVVFGHSLFQCYSRLERVRALDSLALHPDNQHHRPIPSV